MSDEITLLPDDLRKKEEELKKNKPKPEEKPAELKFSIPVEEGEDIEVIEVDEGELDQVLANEPLLTRLAFKVTTFLDDVKTKLFQSSAPPLPPKLPPQFFTPPAKKHGTSARVSVAPSVLPSPAAKTLAASASNVTSKARIMPSAVTPRRVRIIKRVRKPVRVSFVSEEELKLLHIDIPKRRFTFTTAVVFFSILIGGGYLLLNAQLQTARDGLANIKGQTAKIRRKISDTQGTWSAFQDLEPRLKALGVLLNAHVSPTHLLNEIEKNTLATVSYGSFSLTPDDRVALTVTANSFASAAGQIVAFQNSGFVKKVDASGYTVTYNPPSSDIPSAVQFQVTLTLTDDAMHQPAITVTQ